MMVAGFSDGAGRRPAYNFCFIVYIAANIGLALQRDYAALLVLRCVQSAGSSGTVALALGVVADLVTSAERGEYVAYTSLTSIVGPIIGPIIGGVIAQYAGWWWIFWFLVIASTIFFVLIVLFLQETCRKVVGDGSIPPPPLNQNITDIVRQRNRLKRHHVVDPFQVESVRKNYHLAFPNPLSTLRIVTDKEAAIVLFCSGLIFACLYATTTAIPSQFGRIYGFDELKLGLVYIPFGSGGIISAFTTGRIVDWNYRRHAKRNGFPTEKSRQQDLTDFPIEKARLEIALPLLYSTVVGMIGFGWVLHFQTNLAGPLIFLFIFGFGVMAAFQVVQILMVDINPGDAAAATAANNLFRCLLGAGSTAVVIPIIDRLGIGWTYTLFGLVWIAFSPLLWVLIQYGPLWRRQKKDKQDRKVAQKKGDNIDVVTDNHNQPASTEEEAIEEQADEKVTSRMERDQVMDSK